MRKVLLLFLVSTLSNIAQVPNLLKDINSGAGNSDIGPFSALPDNDVLFSVSAPSAQFGLWISDGSSSGTKFFKGLLVFEFLDYAGKKYLSNYNGGYPLWRSDGTPAGTDSIPVPGLSAVSSMTVLNNLLLFVGSHSVSGTELWRSDGTIAGTYILKDIWPGTAIGVNQVPYRACANGYYFFVANDGLTGGELWRTDGTTAGTILLKDIYPGSASSNISTIWAGNNGIYFLADDGTNGMELWFSDGTSANTIMMLNYGAGSTPAAPDFPPLFLGNTAYYSYASSVLYKSDGTIAGTSSVALFPSLSNSVTSWLMKPGIQEYNGDLYYLLANEYYSSSPPIMGYTDTVYFYRITPTLGSKTLMKKTYYNRTMYGFSGISFAVPYKTGPHLMYVLSAGLKGHLFIYNVAQNTYREFYNSHSNMFNNTLAKKTQVFGNKLYLPAYGTGNGFEPCYVDLQTDSLIKIKPGANISLQCPQNGGLHWNHEIFELNGKKYFLGYTTSTGTEFYETDFTPAGTFLLKDIYPGSDSYFGLSTSPFYCNDGKLNGILTPNNIFFAANDGVAGRELWSFINSPNPSGISENARGDGDIKVFPNPTQKKFSVHSTSVILKIQILGLDGKLLLEQVGDEQSFDREMSTPSEAGLYLVRVQTEGRWSTHKLMVIR